MVFVKLLNRQSAEKADCLSGDSHRLAQRQTFGLTTARFFKVLRSKSKVST